MLKDYIQLGLNNKFSHGNCFYIIKIQTPLICGTKTLSFRKLLSFSCGNKELSDVVIFTKSGRKLEPSLTNVSGQASPPWVQQDFKLSASRQANDLLLMGSPHPKKSHLCRFNIQKGM